MPMLQQGNIDLNNRPVVQNPDGSISTVRSMSINVDGNEILIPTVSDDGRILSDREAINQYRRTGQHLGIFSDPDSATDYAEKLHLQQEQMYAKPRQQMPDMSAAQAGMRKAFGTPEPRPEQQQGPSYLDQVSSFLKKQFSSPAPAQVPSGSGPQLDQDALNSISQSFKGQAQKDALSKLRR